MKIIVVVQRYSPSTPTLAKNHDHHMTKVWQIGSAEFRKDGATLMVGKISIHAFVEQAGKEIRTDF